MWLLLYKFKILFVVGEGAASHLSEYRASRQCVCLYEKKKKNTKPVKSWLLLTVTPCSTRGEILHSL